MRIVLVDPSRTRRLIVTRMLEARGHDVLPLADELDALAVIKADLSIDGMITSAELSNMSGVELCWETRLLATCRRPIYRPLPEAIEIAEDLRARLAARPFDTGKDRITLTWSIGVGEGRPGDSVDQILARADAALYDAKLGGRNRVVSADARLLTRPAIVSDGLARASVF
jgi:PleD family two-component response regulator